ncbi:hypothetical protein [Daejeonella sp.]|uniref:hypothetical protein n=1 Tax=Daejeonella sp. TaxID=2805397 RepID=UPI0025C6ED82|nr:hypothetical protein [Daejeonella sp.]
MDQLIKLGFTESAQITFETEFKINFLKNEAATNILYAFVLVDSENISDWKVLYIGHTRKTFKNRMYGYQRGNGNGVNNRLHNVVKSYLKIQNKQVKIYCLTDQLNLLVQSIELDLAAGLEYSLISYYVDYNSEQGYPELINIAGNKNYKSSSVKELEELVKLEKEEEEESYTAQDQPEHTLKNKTFSYCLNKTYWESPFLNIPSNLSEYFGDNGDTAVFHFYKNKNLVKSIPVIINRNAVKNGSPRFYLNGIDGKWFQDWKHLNFEKGENTNVSIISKNNLVFNY